MTYKKLKPLTYEFDQGIYTAERYFEETKTDDNDGYWLVLLWIEDRFPPNIYPAGTVEHDDFYNGFCVGLVGCEHAYFDE